MTLSLPKVPVGPLHVVSLIFRTPLRMPLEAATYISSLNSSNPAGTDTVDRADDHLRLIKATLLATFPGITGAVTPTHTELNYVDGVTSAIQTQLDAKQTLDASLTAYAALVTAADKGLYFTAADTPATFSLTAAGLALLDDADAATQATTLGLGTGNSPQFTGIELGHATDTTLTRSAAGRLAVEGAEVAHTADVEGQQTIWVPYTAMIARTTNGSASGAMESTTNDVMTKYGAFDTTTSEGAQFAIQMPKSWDEGTIIAQFVWTHPATTVDFGVTWGLRAVAFADDDALDTAYGTGQIIADTGGTTSDVYISGETPAITVAGTPAAEELVSFEVYRSVADAGDTLAVDAYLIGVKIHYTADAAKDD